MSALNLGAGAQAGAAAKTPSPSTKAGAGIASRLARRAGLAVFLTVFALFVVGPLVWLALRAFSGTWQYPDLLPQTWTLKWWTQVLDSADLGSSIRLSFVFAPVVTFVSAVICLPAAYAFARLRVPRPAVPAGVAVRHERIPEDGPVPRDGRGVLFAAADGYVPRRGDRAVVGHGRVHDVDARRRVRAVPRSLEEAARDAGARTLRVFLRITFPLAAPGILVAMILSFLASFDEAQGTYLVGAPNT